MRSRQGNGQQVAINVENDRLVGVLARARGTRVVVEGWVSAERPGDVDAADASAMGRWINEELKKAGMLGAARRASAIFAVPRGEVVMKRITFPPGGEDADLPGMVHLQMVRQLTVSPESAAIDYVPIPTTTGPTANLTTKAGTTVLAAALQGERVDWRRAVARAAGLRLGRVALKSAGAAALLAETSARRGGGLLGIALGCGSTEFVVVEDGQLVFARATDLVRPESGAGFHARPTEAEELFAEKVAVEAKRTWMSYRVTPDSAEIEAVVVLGADEVSKRVAARCAESMEMSAETAEFPGFVETPAAMPARDRSATAALVGLIAEPAIGRATLDFANPRRAPDVAAARRQKVLLGTLAAILVLGGGYTAMRLDLRNRESELDGLKAQWTASTDEYAELVRNKARLEHLRRWMDTRVDWLAHLSLLSEQMPDPREAQLDSIGGHGGAAVTYKKAEGVKAYSEDGWSQAVQGVFNVEGRMKSREVADDLRARLVSDQRYKLESKGADLWNRFDWKLTTSKGVPEKAGESKAPEPKKESIEKKTGDNKPEVKPPGEKKPAEKKLGLGGKRPAKLQGGAGAASPSGAEDREGGVQ